MTCIAKLELATQVIYSAIIDHRTYLQPFPACQSTVSVILDPSDDDEPLDIPEFDYSDIDIDALEREVQEELAARVKYGEDPSDF